MNEIFKRKSVRQYQDKIVEDEKIELLLKAAMQAPSAMNQQPWEFIVVKDKKTLEKLGTITPYSAPASRAPLVIVALGNMEGLKAPSIWMVDVAAAIENLLLEAVSLDLGGVWMGIVEESRQPLADLFGYPETVVPLGLIAIGYPLEDPGDIIPRYNKARVHQEKW